MDALVPSPTHLPLRRSPATDARTLVEEFRSRFHGTTLLAYEGDLRRFARWVGAPNTAMAADHLVSLGAREASRLVRDWIRDMGARGLAPSTIRRAVSALQAVVRLAARLERCEWALNVEDDLPKIERVEDRRGPSLSAVRALFAQARQDDSPRGARSVALLHLLYTRALRVHEATGLDLEHLRLDRGELRVLGKGHAEREVVQVTPPVVRALEGWLSRRPRTPSPALLVGLPPPQVAATRDPSRLADRDAREILRGLAGACEIDTPVRPHGLRHSAATHLLDAGGTMRDAQALLRHRNYATTSAAYDDSVARLALGAQDVLLRGLAQPHLGA